MLRAFCVTAAVMACGQAAIAQSADDDDENAAHSAKHIINWLAIPDLTGSGAPALDWLTGGMPDRLLYFTGFDIWRNGLDGYAGVQWSPSHMDRQGFILRLSISDGYDRFVSSTHRYETLTQRFTLQPGYKFKGNTIELQVLAGVEVRPSC